MTYVPSDNEFHVHLSIGNGELAKDRLHNSGNPVRHFCAYTAWIYFITGDKVLRLFPETVHETKANDISISDDHITTDEVPISIENVLFCQCLARKRIGNGVLVRKDKSSRIVASKECHSFTSAGIQWLDNNRIGKIFLWKTHWKMPGRRNSVFRKEGSEFFHISQNCSGLQRIVRKSQLLCYIGRCLCGRVRSELPEATGSRLPGSGFSCLFNVFSLFFYSNTPQSWRYGEK